MTELLIMISCPLETILANGPSPRCRLSRWTARDGRTNACLMHVPPISFRVNGKFDRRVKLTVVGALSLGIGTMRLVLVGVLTVSPCFIVVCILRISCLPRTELGCVRQMHLKRYFPGVGCVNTAEWILPLLTVMNLLGLTLCIQEVFMTLSVVALSVMI